MHIANIIAGLALLLFGRKLFWLFLGIAGFLVGMEITPLLLSDPPRWLQLTVAIGMGGLGAFLAILAQRLAFAVGGFFAGMYLALATGHFFGLASPETMLVVAIAAGLIGAIVATLIMDTAITLLACLVGAGAIVGELPGGRFLDILIFIILVWAGFVFQQKGLSAAQKK